MIFLIEVTNGYAKISNSYIIRHSPVIMTFDSLFRFNLGVEKSFHIQIQKKYATGLVHEEFPLSKFLNFT